MMNILITGGCGYIGSHTTLVLANAGYNVIVLDNCSNSYPEVIDRIEQLSGSSIPFVQGDLRDRDVLDRIFQTHKIGAVIHFGAKKAVGESMEIPYDYYDNNVNGSRILLEAMDRAGVRLLVFSSTCAVYSADNKPPYDESMKVGPESVYGLTKRICEQMIEGLTWSKKLSACVLRYFNPIGNHESGLIGEDPIQKPQNIMPIVMEVVRGERSFLPVLGDQYSTRDGTCIRDYLHVMDLAQAHLQALQRLIHTDGVSKDNQKSHDIYEIINLGTGTGTTVLEIIHSTQEALGVDLPYKIVPPRPGDLPAVYTNPSKAKQLLDWQTHRTIADAVRDIKKFAQWKERQ